MRAGPAVLLAAMIGVLATSGCGGAEDRVDPPRRLGHEIVVTGSVERRLDATSFVLASEAEPAGLLVVAPGQAVADDDVVEVMGVVRRFERRAVQVEVGRRLDPRRYASFEGADFVHAERVAVRT